MSEYRESYDKALSKTPWLSKPSSNGQTYLYKFAPHPDKPGYLFVATDLKRVLFDELSATSIVTRLDEMAERHGAEAQSVSGQLSYDERQVKADGVLATLSETFEVSWSDAKLDVADGDYYDADISLRCGPFEWLFFMTEMRGRQPLHFICKQLLSPFTQLVAQERSVEVKRGRDSSNTDVAEAVGAVISDSGVMRALRRVSGMPPPPASRLGTPGIRRASQTSREPTAEQEVKPRDPSPVKGGDRPAVRTSGLKSEIREPVRPYDIHPTSPTPPSPRTKSVSPQPTPRPRTPLRPTSSKAPEFAQLLPPSSPTPIAGRTRVYDLAAGFLPSSDPNYDRHDETDAAGEEVGGDDEGDNYDDTEVKVVFPASQGKPKPNPTRAVAAPDMPGENKSTSRKTAAKALPPSSPPPSPPPAAGQKLPQWAHPTSDMEESTVPTTMPTSTQDPLMPTQHKKRKKKKKDKDIEEEEVAEAELRREALKKRLGGGGGGKVGVGRRRL